MEQYLQNFNENISNYQERTEDKKLALSKLGAAEKELPLQKKITQLGEIGGQTMSGVMAGVEFGRAYMEGKATEGIKNLMRRYTGRGGAETGTGAGAETQDREAGAGETPAVAEAPVSRIGMGAEDVPMKSMASRAGRDYGRYSQTGRGRAATRATAAADDDPIIPTYSDLDIAQMGRESREMRAAAMRSSREKGLGVQEEGGTQTFKYQARPDPRAVRGYGERYGGAGEEGYGGLRGSSTLARATRGGSVQVQEAEQMGAERSGVQLDPRITGDIGIRTYGETAARRVSRQARRAVAQPEAQIARTEGTALTGEEAYRGVAPITAEAEGRDVAEGEVAGGEVATGEEASTLLGTIGGWSGALNILGGAGMLVGLGVGIAGDIEASKQEGIETRELGQEEQILKHPPKVGFGSLAMPTYDTSTMRGGGGYEHF